MCKVFLNFMHIVIRIDGIQVISTINSRKSKGNPHNAPFCKEIRPYSGIMNHHCPLIRPFSGALFLGRGGIGGVYLDVPGS